MAQVSDRVADLVAIGLEVTALQGLVSDWKGCGTGLAIWFQDHFRTADRAPGGVSVVTSGTRRNGVVYKLNTAGVHSASRG